MASNLATIRVELIANAQKFKTSLDKATTSMKKVDKATKSTAVGSKKMQKSFSNLAGSIAAVQGPLGPVAGRISAIGAIMGRVSARGLIFTGMLVGAGLALTKLVKNTSAVQTQMLKLEAILKATGGAAGLSLSEIEDLSRDIGIGTLASVAKVRDAAGILLTFKSITGDVFKSALRLAQDLAEVGFGDLKMGATQLGKALEDPIIGLGALRRVGVSFTDAQKEMIKVLVMTGKKAEAQKIILEALNQQVGGAGVKAAKGLAGAVDSLKENFDIFFENTVIGTKIVDGLTVAINFMADAFGDADKNVAKLTTIKQVSEELAKLNAELLKNIQLQIEGDESGSTMGDFMNMDGSSSASDTGRMAELQELIKKAEDRIAKLTKEKKKKDNDRPTMADIAGPITQETILGDLRIKNDKAHKRATDRAIEDMGKTAAELKNLNDLRKIEDDLRKKIGSEGKAANDAIANQMKKATQDILDRNAALDVMAKKQEELNKLAEGTGSIFASVGDKISDAMFRGKISTLDFKSILLEMIIALQKMVFKVMVLDKIQRGIEERMKKGGLSIGSIIKMGVGAITGGATTGTTLPGQAGGGTVQQGSPTLVGERGPELFVPNSAGSIRTNADTKQMVGGGGGVSITQNLNFAVGITNTVRAEVMNMLPSIQQSTINAVADAKQRGGKFSKAFGS